MSLRYLNANLRRADCFFPIKEGFLPVPAPGFYRYRGTERLQQVFAFLPRLFLHPVMERDPCRPCDFGSVFQNGERPEGSPVNRVHKDRPRPSSKENFSSKKMPRYSRHETERQGFPSGPRPSGQGWGDPCDRGKPGLLDIREQKSEERFPVFFPDVKAVSTPVFSASGWAHSSKGVEARNPPRPFPSTGFLPEGDVHPEGPGSSEGLRTGILFRYWETAVARAVCSGENGLAEQERMVGKRRWIPPQRSIDHDLAGVFERWSSRGSRD